MGASTNPNAAHIATLQERKQAIEENLAKCNEELRQLCIQEAELTGYVPSEIPIEYAFYKHCPENSYQLSENVLNLLYDDEESISSIEMNMQIQANLAEAALALANQSSINKINRQQHMTEYQIYKKQYTILEEKLAFLKAQAQTALQNNQTLQQQPKQRKNLRPVIPGDSIPLNGNMLHYEPFEHLPLRHRMRSLQHPLIGGTNDHRNIHNFNNRIYRNSDTSMYRPEDTMVSGIYRLSLNGYKTYMERKENNNTLGTGSNQSHYMQPQYNPNLHQQQFTYLQMASQTRLQVSQHPYQGYKQLNNLNCNTQPMHEYTTCTLPINPKSIMTFSGSSSSNSPARVYSKSPTGSFKTHCRRYPYAEVQFRSSNPHQIQPHQRYEHDMIAGLGGYWKRMDSGELIWCNSVQSDSWSCDKRFGSLDRRRNRLHKRTSPLVDPKPPLVPVTMPYSEYGRPTHSKSQQIPSRNQQEVRQLIRTQSLGSVGAQTVDSIWPSDDSSSCGGDACSINDTSSIRKQKQKEWFETSLDGPSRTTTIRSHSTASSITLVRCPISPEEKYVKTTSPNKPILEIPAESNRNMASSIQEPAMEFNSNFPKNGTLIQAGHCKPYHEETKPFEMSDFYKYSTKFKKASKQENSNIVASEISSPSTYVPQSANNNDNSLITVHKGIYQPLQSLKCQAVGIDSFNDLVTNIDNTGGIKSTHIAENFSKETNLWHQNQEDDNNNSGHSTSNSRSTATLV